MQVAIAKKQDTGEIMELDDITYQFVLWLNENDYTEPDPFYARSTMKTTVGKFNEIATNHSFEGEDEMLVPQLNYFVELNNWVCFDADGPKDLDEEITIVFEIAEVEFDRKTMKETYKPVEITYLKSFIASFIKE